MLTAQLFPIAVGLVIKNDYCISRAYIRTMNIFNEGVP